MRSILKMSLLAIAIFFAANMQAQSPLSFGIKGGLNLSSYGGNTDGMKLKPGFQFGFMLNYDIESALFVHSEIAIMTKGAKNELADGVNLTLSPLYLQVPVHIGYKHHLNEKNRIFAHVGPYIAFGISGSYHMKFDTPNFKGKSSDEMFGDDLFKRFDFGAGAAVGVELNKTVLTLGYDMGLLNLADGKRLVFDEGHAIESGGKDAKVKSQNIYLTVGYKF